MKFGMKCLNGQENLTVIFKKLNPHLTLALNVAPKCFT